MALRYVNPRAASNGDGLTWATAWNTFAGITWGSNTYMVGGGTLLETITFGASGAAVIGIDPDDMPVIDCEATRASGINLNSATGCEVAYMKVVGQDAAAPNAAIRVTGSGHKIHHNHTADSRHGIHVNLSAGNWIYSNLVDVGSWTDLTQGYGIRLNGAAATNNRIYENRFVCTRVTPANYIVGSVFGVAIELSAAVSNYVRRNVMSAAMCDQIIARVVATSNYIEHNLCYGTGMLDGIDVLNSVGNVVRFNTVIHPGDVPGHAGPCMAIGDDYGSGVASTDTTVQNNLLWANNRLCFSIRPLGTGFAVANNRLYRTGASDNAVANVDEGAGFVATNMTEWLAKAWVTDDTFGDPEIGADYRPLLGSPLLSGGLHIVYTTDLDGRQMNNPPTIGAYEGPVVRSAASAREPRV